MPKCSQLLSSWGSGPQHRTWVGGISQPIAGGQAGTCQAGTHRDKVPRPCRPLGLNPTPRGRRTLGGRVRHGNDWGFSKFPRLSRLTTDQPRYTEASTYTLQIRTDSHTQRSPAVIVMITRCTEQSAAGEGVWGLGPGEGWARAEAPRPEGAGRSQSRAEPADGRRGVEGRAAELKPSGPVSGSQSRRHGTESPLPVESPGWCHFHLDTQVSCVPLGTGQARCHIEGS